MPTYNVLPRTFKAPAMEFENRLVFSRFKYAEEAAHKFADEGKVWVMFRDHDKIEIEAGVDPDGVPYRDEFSIPQFVVLWNE